MADYFSDIVTEANSLVGIGRHCKHLLDLLVFVDNCVFSITPCRNFYPPDKWLLVAIENDEDHCTALAAAGCGAWRSS
jgi:hypothetical protein